MTFNNLQEIEEVFVGTINECKRHLKGGELIALFESVNFDNDFNPKNKIQFHKYHGNKIAYFNAVNELLENKVFDNTMLFESEDFSSFKAQLVSEINDLHLIDEINKLLRLDPLVLRTKVLSGSPLIVKGFDILNFNKILSANGLDKCFFVAYCKTTKVLLFLSPSNLYIYSIETGNIETQKTQSKLTVTQALDYINTIYSRNVLILASNDPTEAELKNMVKDNLFSDQQLGNKYKQMFKQASERNITR